MPRFKKILEFEDHELEQLKETAPAKAISDVTKPYVDSLKALAKDVQKLTTQSQVDTEDLSQALGSIKRLRQEVESLPDSEGKDRLLESLANGRDVIQGALEMSENA